MKAKWIITAAAVAPLLMQPAAAVPLASAATSPAPARADLVLVQSGDAAGDRMQRLRQHRAILENALAPRDAVRAQRLEPQTRPLQPPREDDPPEPEWSGDASGQIDCEAAAAVVADYGFSDVRPTDCAGGLYTFSAMRDGTAYALSVRPDGEIAEVRRQ